MDWGSEAVIERSCHLSIYWPKPKCRPEERLGNSITSPTPLPPRSLAHPACCYFFFIIITGMLYSSSFDTSDSTLNACGAIALRQRGTLLSRTASLSNRAQHKHHITTWKTAFTCPAFYVFLSFCSFLLSGKSPNLKLKYVDTWPLHSFISGSSAKFCNKLGRTQL